MQREWFLQTLHVFCQNSPLFIIFKYMIKAMKAKIKKKMVSKLKNVSKFL